MTYNPFPLHPSLIRPADPEYQVDLAPQTQETLRRRAEQIHPTMSTTAGRPEWRVGRAVDLPSSSNGPAIFSPSMLQKQKDGEPSNPSIDDLRRRLGLR